MYNHDTIINPIDAKIEILRDFCVLRPNACRQEAAVRAILSSCANERQMEIKLHDLILGDETIKEFIARHKNTQSGLLN